MSPVYRFGEFELDSERRELRCGSAAVSIQPRPLDLLLYLAAERDRVVPRSELLDALWTGVQVNDEALGFAIHQARRAVRDDGSRQAVIRTVSRAGFRFVAPLAAELAQEGEAAATFVGRADLLRGIDAALRDAASGTRSLVLLRGEAGIGKTRTAEVAMERARAQGFEVLGARCVESEGAPVFWPWIQLLRPIVAGLPDAELAHAVGPGGPELARLLPELRERLPDLPDPASDDPKAARFLLFDGATALVRSVAAQRPVLLVIDDLHRADLSSLSLLRDLTGQLAGARVALLATHREAELAQDDARSLRVAELVREEGTRLLALPGLADDEVGELLRLTTGHVSSAAVRADLRERTNGNPFFLHQVVHVLQSEQRTHEVESDGQLRFELPRHSQDAIAHQVTSLPAGVVEVLEVAAVLGRDFSLRPLELAMGRGRDELGRLLDPAIEARILQRARDGSAPFRFAHVLLRDALYQRIDPARRARIHGDVGRALLALEAEGGGGDPPTVAHHFFEAAHEGEVSEAVAIALRAGRWSEERLAFEEAVTSFEQALDLCDRASVPDQGKRCEILLALGDANTKAGRREAARECFTSVARLAKTKGLPEQLASAALRFAPDFLAIETGVHDPELVSLLEDALAALPASDSLVRARLLGRLAVALHWAPGSESRRRRLCTDAVEMAARMGDAASSRYVGCATELALYSVDHPERYIRQPSAIQLEHDDAPIILLEQLLRMTALLQCGRVPEYERGIEVFSTLARQLRQPQAMWYVELFRATQAILEGRFADAEAHAQSYWAEGQRFQDKNAMHSLEIQMFMLAIDRGGIQGFEARLREMVDQFPSLLGWRCALALFYAEAGYDDRCLVEIERILDRGLETAPKRNEWLAAVSALGIAGVEVGHTLATETAYRLMEPHGDEFLVVGYSSYCWGSVATVLGVTAGALGRVGLAEREFEKAASMNRSVRALPALARTRFYEGRMLAALGQLTRAGSVLSEAHRIATTLRLQRMAGRAEELHSRIRRP